MGKWTDYATKSAPVNADDLMIYDATAKANKRATFSGVWNWIVDRLANAVVSKLTTSNKTVIGAVNELNNKTTTALTQTTDAQTGFTIESFEGYYTKSGKNIVLILNVKGSIKTEGTFFKICDLPDECVPEKTMYENYIAQDGTIMTLGIAKDEKSVKIRSSKALNSVYFLRRVISF